MARLALDLAFCTLLAGVSAADLERRVVPNEALAIGAAAALSIAGVAEPASLPERSLAAAAAGLPLAVLALACPRGLGMGDAKLAAVMGLYLGWSVAPALLVAFGAGAVAGSLLVAREGALARRRAIPFAPFLALGGLVALCAGHGLIAWYLTSFVTAR